MLVTNFLAPSECEDIKKLAQLKGMEPSTVLAQVFLVYESLSY
jgi:hypothetical protein